MLKVQFILCAALLTVTATPGVPIVTVVNNCGSSTLTVNSFSGSLLWSTGETTASITVTNAGTYTVTETVNGCSGPSGSGTASISAKPVLTSPLTASVKSGDSFNYTATSSETGAMLTWGRAAVSGISNPAAIGSGDIHETLINTTNSPVNVTYEYTLTLGGCVNKQHVVVTVNPSQGGSSACTNTTSIKYKFNSRRIEKGKYIWFNSSFNALGIGKNGKKDPVTITVTNSKISFTVYGKKYSLPVPDSRIIFTPDVTSARTQFVNNVWETTVPYYFKDDVFMGGLSYLVPNNLPGNIRNVVWSADVSIDQPGVSLFWDWGAAVYSKLGNNGDLKIKPVDGWRYNSYFNFDNAGTPENYKAFLRSGGFGHGYRKHYTGRHSGKKKISCGDNNNNNGHDGDHHFVTPPYWTGPKQITPPNGQGTQNRLDVRVGPNPSHNYFTLSVSSKNNDPVTVIISDNFGKIMEKYERVNASGTLRFGDKLKTGFYLVEVIQGEERKTVKVLKIN